MLFFLLAALFCFGIQFGYWHAARVIIKKQRIARSIGLKVQAVHVTIGIWPGMLGLLLILAWWLTAWGSVV